MAATTLERSSFSRRSATYTASTFTAFEYGSTYEYHGMYNVQGEEQNEDTKKVEKVELDDDIDDLLNDLSPEELAELSVIDPDVRTLKRKRPKNNAILQDSSVPPSLRCLYHCDKKPSKTLSHSNLVQFLRQQSLEDPNREEIVPYVAGQKRGKPVNKH